MNKPDENKFPNKWKIKGRSSGMTRNYGFINRKKLSYNTEIKINLLNQKSHPELDSRNQKIFEEIVILFNKYYSIQSLQNQGIAKQRCQNSGKIFRMNDKTLELHK